MWGDSQPHQHHESNLPQGLDFDGIVADSVGACLESMVFSPVLPLDVVWARIPIVEPVEFEIELMFSRQLAFDMAATAFAGDSETVDDIIVKDVVGEFANTIAGRIMASAIPSGGAFTLGLPKVEFGRKVDRQVSARTWYFETDGKIFSLTVKPSNILESLSL